MRTRRIEFVVFLDEYGLEKMRVKLVTRKNDLIDMVYQYESYINNKWNAIVRYDCAHGFFHRDLIHPNGDKEKKEIKLDNLKEASRFADFDIRNRWEWYKECYIKKLEK